MATYIQLLTLTPEGRANTLENSSFLLRAQHFISSPEITVLGLYGVLGPYNFVNIVEAPGDEAVARFSIELGVRGGVDITTMPTVPVSKREPPPRPDPSEMETSVSLPQEGE